MKKAIVTVAIGKRMKRYADEPVEEGEFSASLGRWTSSFTRHGEEAVLWAFRELPPDSPTHEDIPYAFKLHAIKEARRTGASLILWADSSVFAVQSLTPLWDYVEKEGYWLSRNRDWNCGQWACDAALPLLGVTREEAFGIPQMVATTFALNFENRKSQDFFSCSLEFSHNRAFRGPWYNHGKEASGDLRVLGHRHDQTAMSVAAWKIGLKLEEDRQFFTNGSGRSADTVLDVSWR